MTALVEVLAAIVVLAALAMCGAKAGVLTFQLRKPPKPPKDTP